MAHSSRLFVALWPDVRTREQIATLQKEVMTRTGMMEGAVAVENLHMTLRFLGDVPAADCESLKASLSTVQQPPFHLELDRWGHFPRPGILWAGPSVPPQDLIECQQQALIASNGFGHGQKEKSFCPHVTLFRKVHHLPMLDEFEAVEWLVDRLVLVESSTHPDGVRYRVISEFFFD